LSVPSRLRVTCLDDSSLPNALLMVNCSTSNSRTSRLCFWGPFSCRYITKRTARVRSSLCCGKSPTNSNSMSSASLSDGIAFLTVFSSITSERFGFCQKSRAKTMYRRNLLKIPRLIRASVSNASLVNGYVECEMGSTMRDYHRENPCAISA